MAEQTYKLPEEPVYHDAVRRLRRQDPGDAESIFNPLIQAMLENTEFVRQLALAIAEQNAADHEAILRQMAESIRSAIAGIPTPDVSGQISRKVSGHCKSDRFRNCRGRAHKPDCQRQTPFQQHLTDGLRCWRGGFRAFSYRLASGGASDFWRNPDR